MRVMVSVADVLDAHPGLISGFTEWRPVTSADFADAVSELPSDAQAIADFLATVPLAENDALRFDIEQAGELLSGFLSAIEAEDYPVAADWVPVTVFRLESRGQRTISLFGTPDELLTIEEVAAIVKNDPPTIRALLDNPDSGLDGFYSTDGAIRIQRSALSAYIEMRIETSRIESPRSAGPETGFVIAVPVPRGEQPSGSLSPPPTSIPPVRRSAPRP